MLWLKDFRMAGYLVSKGLVIAEMRFDARNDVEVGFDDPTGEASRTLREYGGSAEHRYEMSCKFVHDLIRLKLRNR